MTQPGASNAQQPAATAASSAGGGEAGAPQRFDPPPGTGPNQIENVLNEVEQLTSGIDAMLRAASSSTIGSSAPSEAASTVVDTHAKVAAPADSVAGPLAQIGGAQVGGAPVGAARVGPADDAEMMQVFDEDEPSDIHALDRMLAAAPQAEDVLVGDHAMEDILASGAREVASEPQSEIAKVEPAPLVTAVAPSVAADSSGASPLPPASPPFSASVPVPVPVPVPVSPTMLGEAPALAAPLPLPIGNPSVLAAAAPATALTSAHAAGAALGEVDQPWPATVTASHPDVLLSAHSAFAPVTQACAPRPVAPVAPAPVPFAPAPAATSVDVRATLLPLPGSDPPPRTVDAPGTSTPAGHSPRVRPDADPSAASPVARPRKARLRIRMPPALKAVAKVIALSNLPLRMVPASLRPAVNVLALSLALWTPVVWWAGPKLAQRAASAARAGDHEPSHQQSAIRREKAGHDESKPAPHGGH